MKTITIMADFGNGPYAWLRLRDGKSASDGDWVSGLGCPLGTGSECVFVANPGCREPFVRCATRLFSGTFFPLFGRRHLRDARWRYQDVSTRQSLPSPGVGRPSRRSRRISGLGIGFPARR